MKCPQIEKLLPLYVGDDLPADQMESVRTHLADCTQCFEMAAGFSESRSWFREAAIPSFDEADLANMRASVHQRIAEEHEIPGLLDRIFASLSLRPVFVAAAAAIILLGAVLYGLRSVDKPPNQVKPDIAREAEIRDGNEVIDPTGRKTPQTAGRDKPRRIRRKAVKTRSDLIARTDPLPLETKQEPSEQLRIELQTSDPNIRIIWLARK
ncbi:MAG: zf-HC2 domain-containing protein [Acidobacteria bacterium]|nr:zf-HC2 domain-containing protein [Acidobacteriota bacterium]